MKLAGGDCEAQSATGHGAPYATLLRPNREAMASIAYRSVDQCAGTELTLLTFQLINRPKARFDCTASDNGLKT
jgi:hypothetical protein